MKRLVIHPGFHKSGTTALQQSLHENRGKLLELGISYPFPRFRAHHRIAWSLSQRVWGWQKRGGSKESPKLWRRAVRAINRDTSGTTVISSEFFSEIDVEKIKELRNSIKGKEIDVVFTLRPLAKVLSSSYQQYLKYGLKADYKEWLHSIFDVPGESKLNPTFWKRHMHGTVIANWAEVFGAEHITVIIVDEKRPEFLFDSINDYLRIPRETLIAPNKRLNRSLTTEEISLLLEINRNFPKERSWDQYELFIRNGFIRELTDNTTVAEGKDFLLTPEWAIEKANNLGSQFKRELTDLNINVIGDIDSLDKAQVPSGESLLPKTIDINTAASAMLSIDKNLWGGAPLIWMRRNFVFRVRRWFKTSFSPKRS